MANLLIVFSNKGVFVVNFRAINRISSMYSLFSTLFFSVFTTSDFEIITS